MIYLGTLSGLVRFHCPSQQDTDHASPYREVPLLDGGSALRGGRGAPRRWSVGIGLAKPEEMAALSQLLRFGTPPWVFVSEDAVSTNGLTPRQGAFHAATLPAGVSPSGMEEVTDTWGRWWAGFSASTVITTEWEQQGDFAPVIPNGKVTVSAGLRSVGFGTVPRLGVQWYNAAGVATTREWVNAPHATSAPLPRTSGTFTAPLTARSARMVFQRATQVVAPALTLTDQVTRWGDGRGAPRVFHSGWSVSLLMAVAGTGQQYEGHSLSLVEVGALC